jgi:hypothetical protein
MNMTSRLLDRIRRLEQRSELARPANLRYGWVKPLPEDYAGERHVVIIKREPTRLPRIEWCEFEERAGGGPRGADDRAITVCSGQHAFPHHEGRAR